MLVLNKIRKFITQFLKSDTFQSNDKYESLIEGAIVGIYIIQDSKFKYVNHRFSEIFGYEENEIITNISLLDLVYEKDRKIVSENIRKRIDGESLVEEYEFRGLRKNGTFVWIKVLGYSIIYNGRPAVSGTLVDISKEKQAQEELENYKDKLEELVKIRTDELETANEELRASNEELYEKGIIINSKNEKLELTLKHLKETQAQLLQSEKMASLGILTAGVSHEINNPLNYIMGAYEGLSFHYKNKTLSENYDEIRVLLDAVKIGVDRSSSIVKSLNQFSRNNKSLSEECDLHDIIDNCLNILYNQYKGHITIEKSFCNSELLMKGNVGELHQVFTNVLNNAIQAIELKGTISIKTELEKSGVIVKISDTGTGISAENLKKITDPFFTTKPPGKGTGLGLSITYNIIKEHKGKIEFESEVGKGTIVKIVLPKNNKK
jgi:PAS domain S-box-containing protein